MPRMDEPRSPLFCDVELAARLEKAAAAFMAAGTHAAHRRGEVPPGVLVHPFAGGTATWARPGSPLNKVAGLGFAGTPAAADLEALERAFLERGAPVQVELSTLAAAGIAELFTGRGYRLAAFENVLAARLPLAARRAPATGIEVRESDPSELTAWLDAVVEGFAAPDAQGVATTEDFPRAVLDEVMRDLAGAEGFRRYLARIDGAVAGGASLFVSDGVAQLAGAATRPAFRRRGVQSALLAARLADAARAGCDIATVTTQPGSRSQQNVQRQGFDLLYARAVLVRGE